MSVKLGTLDISAFKVGSGDCIVYLGTNKLYEPIQPQPKFKAWYSDGTTYEEACDGNTTLTTATTKPSGYDFSAMTDAVVGDCVRNINDWSFCNFVSLSSVSVSDSVISFGNPYSAFQYCRSLVNINIPSGLTSLPMQCFDGCYSLTSITIPDSVQSIGHHSFYQCRALTSVNIPYGVKSLDEHLFDECYQLSSITIPNSVTKIEPYVFYGDRSLTTVTIPSGVTELGEFIFDKCSGLTEIIMLPTSPPTLRYSLGDATCPIYVPAESVNAYKSANIWSGYASRIQAISTN